MMRLLPALIAVALLIAAAVFLADRPGSVALSWQGWRVDTSVAVLGLGTAFVALAGGWIVAMLIKLWRAPRNIMRAWRERRRREGYRALTQGMAAVAAGEPEEAERFARRADALLAEPPLTLLLSAQAAQLKGDEAAARRYFTAMLERKETAFLGTRGLIVQSLKNGEEGVALQLAEQARRLRPKAGWVLRCLYELLARAGRWQEADAALSEAAKRKAIDAGDARRHRAVITYAQGRAASSESADALNAAARAHGLDPGLTAAALWYARLLQAAGKTRRARQAIEQAWRAAPQPDLAAAYAGLYPEENALARLKRCEQLTEANPDHVESRYALARAALAARLWGEARRHVQGGAGAESDPAALSPRFCRLMAEIEAAQHGAAAAAAAWLKRAAESRLADPAFICAACNAAAPEWSPLCPHCRGFDTLAWRSARDGGGSVAWPALPGEPATRSRAAIDAWRRPVITSAALPNGTPT
jgi:HemY protein